MHHLRRPWCLIALALLGLGGCQSITSGSGQGASSTGSSSPVQQSPFDLVRSGMSADSVRQLVGKPLGIRTDAGEGETWLYQRKLDETVRQVPISTRDVPAIDIITGQQITVKESVMADEFTRLYEDIGIRLINGQVVAVTREMRVEKNLR